MAVDASLVGSHGISAGASSATSTAGTSTSGKLLIAVAWFTNTTSDVVIPSVTDSKGNTYSQVGTTQNMSTGDGGIAYFLCESGTSSASHTATVNFKDGSSVAINTFSAYVVLVQISGASATALDVHTQGQDATRPYTLASGTLAQAAEVLIGFCLCDTGSNAWDTPTGVTTVLDALVDGTSPTVQLAKVVTAATTSVLASFNRTADIGDHVSLLFLVGLKDAAGGAISTQSVEDSGRNRPGRGPFSKNAFRLSDTTPFTSSSNVTVSLVGQGATFASGSLSVQLASQWADAGNSPRPGRGPFSQGRFYVSDYTAFTLGSPVTVSLSGQSAGFATGSLTPSTAVSLTGRAGTFAVGSVIPNTSVTLTGQAGTFSSGLLVPSISAALAGRAGTFAPGTLIPNTTMALTGRVATFSVGTMTTGSDVTVSLTGQAATFTAGILAPNTTLALSGGAASFAAGNLLATPTVGLSGQSATFSAGTLSPSSSIPLTGLQASFSAGLLGVIGDVTVALTGLSASFASGFLTAPAVSTGAGPVDSRRIAEGHYRKKRGKVRRVERPIFIAPLQTIPQPVIDRAPNFTALSETLGESPAVLSAHIDLEIEFLMRAQAERDDEDALVWILHALEQLPPD